MTRRDTLTPEGIKTRVHVDARGCWIWRGRVGRRGYGTLSRNGKRVLAHRFSWESFRGPIPDGLFICHHCDVRPCVNPDHLFLGTCADNIRDAQKKGRLARGERHGMSTLTAEIVRAIRAATGSQRSIARQFGIARATARDIRKGTRWAHLLPVPA